MSPKAWTRQDDEKFRELYPVMKSRELVKILDRSYGSVQSYAKRIGIFKRKRKRRFTPAEDQTIIELYPRMLASELAELLGVSESSVYNRSFKLGVKKAADFALCIQKQLGKLLTRHPRAIENRFTKGIVPHNKGKKGTPSVGRMKETQFKKGNKPHTWKPIGTHRFSKEGYLQRKVTDTGYPPRDWRAVHILLWEEHNGQVPPKHIVVFKDKNKKHIAIDNLELLSQANNMRRNTIHNLPKPLKEVIVLNASIKRRIRRIEREKQNRRSA